MPGDYMRNAPLITAELLAYLDEKFPNKCPPVSTPVDEVRALAGEQRVIDHLRKCYKEQDKKALLGGANTVTLTGNGS